MIFRSLPSPSTSTCSFFVWFVLNVEPRHHGNEGKKVDDTQAGRQARRQTVIYKEACSVSGTGMSETLGGMHHNNKVMGIKGNLGLLVGSVNMERQCGQRYKKQSRGKVIPPMAWTSPEEVEDP